MNSLIIVAAVALVPVLLALILRVSSPILFLSIAGGVLLQQHLGDSLALTLAALVKNGPVELIANVGLLVLPVVLTLLVLRKSMKPSSLLLQLLPLILAGITLGYMVLTQLSDAWQAQIYALPFGSVAKQSQDLVVAVAVVANILLAWRLYRTEQHDGKAGKHH